MLNQREISREMKGLARLALFFNNFFILSFLVVAGVRFFFIWTGAVRAIPAHIVEPSVALVAAAKDSLSMVIYSSVLFSLSYSVRRAMSSAFSIFFILLFTFVFSFGLSLTLNRLETADSSTRITRETLGETGLILSSGGVTTVLVGNPADAASPRVVAMPDSPLILRGTPSAPGGAFPSLPPAPFYSSDSRIVDTLGQEFNLVSEQFFARLKSGAFFFCIYLFSLVLLLSSLRFVFEIFAWPLANLFLGALVFRGILSFEVFLNSEETQNLIAFFVGRLIPSGFISPVIYTAIALLVLVYTLLVGTARGRRRRTR
jgi:hypothetical protein